MYKDPRGSFIRKEWVVGNGRMGKIEVWSTKKNRTEADYRVSEWCQLAESTKRKKSKGRLYGHARLGLREPPRSGLKSPPSLSFFSPLSSSFSSPFPPSRVQHLVSFLSVLLSVCVHLFVVTHSFVQCSPCSLGSGGLAVSCSIPLCGNLPAADLRTFRYMPRLSIFLHRKTPYR